MTTALRCENLSKRFALGTQLPYERLSEWLATTVRTAGGLLKPRSASPAEPPRDLWALKEISFEVGQGEVVGIIGRNGAGKSTLLKILSRITPPTSGRAEVHGRVGSLLEVGTGFHPELTGRENVYLNGAILGMSRSEIRRKFDEIVDFSEIEPFIDTPVKRYSSGMTVRLAFAVAAHLEPEVLIIDEVLSVGDMAFQKKCLGKMGDVSRHGRTVLIVSHNLPSIVNNCSRAILLDRGQIAAAGSAADVVKNYLNRSRAAGGEVVWTDPATAPGSESVRLHKVRILQDLEAGATMDVDISQETIIEISYWALRSDTDFFAAFWLRDMHGTDVMCSVAAPGFAIQPPPGYGQPRPAGLYAARCRIPANFLNDRSYRVTAIVNQFPWSTQVLEQDIVEFEVHDQGEMRTEYTGQIFGCVRPQLHWDVHPVSERESLQ